MALAPSYSVPLEQGYPFGWTLTKPAAGAPYDNSDADFQDRRFNMHMLQFQLIAGPAAADRRVILQLHRVGAPSFSHELNFIQVALETKVYFLRPGPGNAVTEIVDNVYGTMPDHFNINPNLTHFHIVIENMQALDELDLLAAWGTTWAQRTE